LKKNKDYIKIAHLSLEMQNFPNLFPKKLPIDKNNFGALLMILWFLGGFPVTMTHSDIPSINVTLPFFTVYHRLSPSTVFNGDRRQWKGITGDGRWWKVTFV
jgi:hypothetical protein